MARIGLAALALIQLGWSSSLYVSGNDRIADSLSLLRTGMEGRGREKLQEYRSEYLALGASLPKKAIVMLHYMHGSLGIERPVILDWVGYQGLIDYRKFRTPGELYARLKKLGVTHIVTGPNPHAGDYRQEEVIFDAFVDRYGRSPQRFGSLSVFPMPAAAPAPEAPFQVLAIGLPGYKDGLYPVESLSTCETLPRPISNGRSPPGPHHRSPRWCPTPRRHWSGRRWRSTAHARAPQSGIPRGPRPTAFGSCSAERPAPARAGRSPAAR